MKNPGLVVYMVRGFDGGSAERTGISIGQGLIEYSEDGGIDYEPVSVYQWDSELDPFFTRIEQVLTACKSSIKRAFEYANSEEQDGDDVHVVNMVLHCHSPHPQVVKEVEKLLYRYFRDVDVYELIDVTVRINPERFDHANDRKACEEFQAQLFA